MPEPQDPFERRLRALAADAARTARPLPADEVRARGRRRGRHRAAVVAALAAVAVVAVGATVAVGGPLLGDRVSPAGTDPDRGDGILQEVPAGFVIDAEPLPVGAAFDPRVGEGPGRDVTRVQVCGEPPLANEPDPVDALGVVTPRTWRGVQVYADEVTAGDVLERFPLAAAACNAADGVWGTAPVQVDDVADAVVTRELGSGGVLTYQLAQRGNALAVVQTTPQPGARRLGAAALAGLVEQMCVFASKGCTSASGDLTADDLPTADELPGYNEQSGWEETNTYPGDGQAPVSICLQGGLSGLGAKQVWTRLYRATFDSRAGTTPDPAAPEFETGLSIAEFADETAAAEAYATVEQWVLDCADCTRASGFPDAGGEQPVPAEVEGGKGFTRLVYYGPAPGDIAELSWIDAHALAVVGDRLVLVTQRSIGQDYNYPDGPSPIEGTLAAALARLAP